VPSTGYILQQVANALVVGSFYSLLAVSYALVHGLTNRIVLSFGEMAMFGAFCAVYAVIIGQSANLVTAAALALALIGTAAISAGVGLATYRAVFAPLMAARSQILLIASISLGIVVQEIMRLQSNGREQWLEPIWNSPLHVQEASGFVVQVSVIQAVVVGGASLLLAAILLLLRRSQLGRMWRACSQDGGLTALIGIDVRRVAAVTFVIASIYAGSAGLIVAVYYGGVSFYMGIMLGLKALFASIIGGFGTVGGAIVGAFILAGLETVWSAFFPLDYRDAAVFLIILLLLVLRPEGLLGVRLRTDHER
jgi:branched-chain amino acid transport system permease protein